LVNTRFKRPLSLKSTAITGMNNRISGSGIQHRPPAQKKALRTPKKVAPQHYFLIDVGSSFDGRFSCTG
jgi:hypothetical protein